MPCRKFRNRQFRNHMRFHNRRRVRIYTLPRTRKQVHKHSLLHIRIRDRSFRRNTEVLCSAVWETRRHTRNHILDTSGRHNRDRSPRCSTSRMRHRSRQFHIRGRNHRRGEQHNL